MSIIFETTRMLTRGEIGSISFIMFRINPDMYEFFCDIYFYSDCKYITIVDKGVCYHIDNYGVVKSSDFL